MKTRHAGYRREHGKVRGYFFDGSVPAVPAGCLRHKDNLEIFNLLRSKVASAAATTMNTMNRGQTGSISYQSAGLTKCL